MNHVRIIGGKWRSRKLPVLDAVGLRPSTDRVRETLFNWLSPSIQGAHCLDCFAGSGALGFEALSRGAQSVVFIEKDKTTVKQLNSIKQQMNTEDAEIVHAGAFDYLQSQNSITKPMFDLVFIDPPFQLNLVMQTVNLLNEHRLLAPNCLIYIETELNCHFNQPTHWQLHRELKTKQLHSRLFINKV